MINKILKFKELSKYVPLSRTTIWRRIKNGQFPKPIDLGGNSKNSAKGWIESDIIGWVTEQQTKKITIHTCDILAERQKNTPPITTNQRTK
jgi:prophage regulatory protein